MAAMLGAFKSDPSHKSEVGLWAGQTSFRGDCCLHEEFLPSIWSLAKCTHKLIAVRKITQ